LRRQAIGPIKAVGEEKVGDEGCSSLRKAMKNGLGARNLRHGSGKRDLYSIKRTCRFSGGRRKGKTGGRDLQKQGVAPYLHWRCVGDQYRGDRRSKRGKVDKRVREPWSAHPGFMGGGLRQPSGEAQKGRGKTAEATRHSRVPRGKKKTHSHHQGEKKARSGKIAVVSPDRKRNARVKHNP